MECCKEVAFLSDTLMTDTSRKGKPGWGELQMWWWALLRRKRSIKGLINSNQKCQEEVNLGNLLDSRKYTWMSTSIRRNIICVAPVVFSSFVCPTGCRGNAENAASFVLLLWELSSCTLIIKKIVSSVIGPYRQLVQ